MYLHIFLTLCSAILEDSLTSQLYADLALISSHCYAPADNRSPQRGQTNPQRGHAGTCGSVVLCTADNLPMFKVCLRESKYVTPFHSKAVADRGPQWSLHWRRKMWVQGAVTSQTVTSQTVTCSHAWRLWFPNQRHPADLCRIRCTWGGGGGGGMRNENWIGNRNFNYTSCDYANKAIAFEGNWEHLTGSRGWGVGGEDTLYFSGILVFIKKRKKKEPMVFKLVFFNWTHRICVRITIHCHLGIHRIIDQEATLKSNTVEPT